ncbi:uncharacterized protein EKO05_0010046 [Ascochyta rabiei]|uniref:DNA binding n=1 Tax=Didymella rabiei TaxID=5454 RepID=A0A163LNQ4_DIDRA|nr:uncharacterized protein EKO05_0010046 [Ascochyta rabiei]KZM27962.1 DNA binding [Ascochyta rabiei]UPX19795.1 hypothetical protein EKO05_0010046 [Ascochyta rabiei]
MVDFMSPSGPPTGATITTFRVAADGGMSDGGSSAPKSRMGGAAMPPATGAQPSGPSIIPLSARKAAPLDLATVERRGHNAPNNLPPKPQRMFGLQEAPTYRPTAEQFKDPVAYMQSIREEAQQYGIVKIVPPDTWNPSFAVDTERFHFRTRRQELNSVEGGTRANLNYLDQLSKFHKQHGHSLTRFPSVDKRPLDLYKLKKAVETRGGFERVCKQKKWAEIGRDLGYSGKIMSSLSTSLKNSYQKWLHPYEEYLHVAKPGVQQMLEHEHGGPFTPSPAHSPLKKPAQGTPTTNTLESPAIKASAALNASLHVDAVPTPPELPRPAVSSGFTAVNSGGFTPVNGSTAPAPSATPATNSFSAVNTPSGPQRDFIDSRTSTPLRNGDSPMLSAYNTPDLRPTAHGLTPLSNSHAFNQLKRTLSQDGESSMNEDGDEANGRRSKRLRKDAPTVAGSHMTQPRQSTPGNTNPRVRPTNDRPGERCESCGTDNDPTNILLCDSCDNGYHGYCLDPPIRGVPAYDWHCPRCLVGTGEFGFEEGGIYSLKQFQERAQSFKQAHFAGKTLSDPVTNAQQQPTEDDIEKEFWRLVENLTETVEVEYGADVHTTTHGSGFPTIERNPRDPYSTDPWNLNILPYAPDSLFRHIKSDISGMTVPWLYVGMVFSTFCWHAEDHYTYSANYQHFGATKTWYGIPAEDVGKFEQAMREAVPELFETQPDLLFQLVTLLTPEQLKKAGVRVYALDQRAGEFVITFPQAYHAGFNHGFNFNEAVNFAPSDWEPFGEHGVLRLQEYRRQPCFSHDELLLAAATRKDITIKTAKWLGPALERMRIREGRIRTAFLEAHKTSRPHTCRLDGSEGPGEHKLAQCQLEFVVDDSDMLEEELICAFCKTYSYLSRFYCRSTKKVLCLQHAGLFECCPGSLVDKRYQGDGGEHVLIHRMTDDAIMSVAQKVADKASLPEAWEAKLEALMAEGPQPQLKVLRTLLNEGEKIDWELPGLPDLKDFVEKCTEVAEEAIAYITRKQQARQKNVRTGRVRGANKATEAEDKDREYRSMENIQKLLTKAKGLGFDCPEITALRERAQSIAEFQDKARIALRDRPSQQSITRLDELLEEGKSFSVDVPELESLEKVVQQLKWLRESDEFKYKPATTLQEVGELIARGVELSIPENHPEIQFLQSKKEQGEFWETKAKELMAVENVHYQQLDALSKQAASLPVTPETRAAVDAILKKQRDAQDLIMSLFERSKNPDFRQRPMYMDVRTAMEQLNALNSKPAGTIDLEKEQKRHEDWMRRGKKLFGKANAPLHILHAHMKSVDERNRSCFDLSDQPRMPVEPASREASPVDGEEVDGSGSSRDVFCICRRPEAGMMIECELCHEWYHGKCLKIARGKVKEDDKYTCPICDYRVKIPRDATRPKLEDLLVWQDELPNLPFQPEEEETLDSIIDHGSKFRDYVQQYINPLMSSPDELTTQRFYLRKLEGADILLSNEINFFRQELHKWAPVAPTAPPILQVSLSTRKPRPTKQQKLMNQLGISNPDDLPPHLRTKTHQFKRKEGEVGKPEGLNANPDPSHTPPGEPRRESGENEYFNSNSASAYNNSPTFATNAPLNFGGSSSIAALDPGLFESSAQVPTSPMQDLFKSSGNGQELFGEAMEMGGGQAEEALAVTEGNSYLD